MLRKRIGPWLLLTPFLAFSLRAEDFDWRNAGGNWVTPVKYQDGNTCWAYGGVAALESRLMLTRGDATWAPDLSEHQVVDRVNDDVSDEQRYYEPEPIDYLSGGWTKLVYDTAQSRGVVSDTEWPGRNATPPTGWTTRTCTVDPVAAYTEGGLSIAQIKADLKRYGPLAVDVRSADLGTSVSSLPEKSNEETDHVAVIVGYHDDPGLVEGGYWILKNSWGVANGTQGYYFARYDVPQYSTLLTSRAHFNGPTAQAAWNGGSGAWGNSVSGWSTDLNGGAWHDGEQAARFAAGSGTITVGASTSAHGVTIEAGANYAFSEGSLIVTGGGLSVGENTTFSTRLRVGYDHDWSIAANKTVTVQDVDLHINQLTVTGAGHTLIRGAIADVTTNVAFAGLLSGSSGSLVKSGAGTLTLGNGPNDAVANTFVGPTTVAGGSLVLNKRAGVPAVGGDLVITGGSVRWGATAQLASGRYVTLRAGTVDLAGHDESIAALTTSGGTITTGGGLLTTGSLTHADGTLAVSGRFAVTGTMRVGRPQPQYSYAATAIENLNLAAGMPGVSTIIPNTDDTFAAINLGTNTFNYFGTRYTGADTLFVSSNALITFGAGDKSHSNTNLATSPTLPAIAPLWDDWRSAGETAVPPAVLAAFEDVNGDNKPDRLIIEWNDNKASGAISTNYITHQAILTLNTGDVPGSIVFNYVDLDSGDGHSNGMAATVGLSAGTTSPVRQLVSYNAANTLVGSGKAIQFTPIVTGNTDVFELTDGQLTAAELINDGIMRATGGTANLGTVDGLGSLTVGGGATPALFTAASIHQSGLTIGVNGRVEITGTGTNVVDFLAIANADGGFSWNAGATSAAAVPEPAMWSLLVLAALAALAMRRRYAS